MFLNLKNIKIPTLNNEFFLLNEQVSFEDFIQIATEHWIPMFDCNYCGRKSYCKYTVQYKNSARLQEIKCGITKEVLRKYLMAFLPDITKTTEENIELFLIATFNYISFIHESQTHTNELIDGGLIDLLENKKQFFNMIYRYREYLNNYAGLITKLELSEVFHKIILVEGKSEELFVSIIKPFLSCRQSFDIQDYSGKPNKSASNLRFFINRLKSQGYKVCISGDSDGNPDSKFKSLLDNKLIEVENCFSFSIDFETSFPNRMLAIALQTLYPNNQFSEILIEKLKTKFPNQSIVKLIEKHSNITIDKILLTEKLSQLVIEEIRWKPVSEANLDEVGQFLNWLEK